MSTARELVERAFSRLAERPGYTSRQDQLQLALLLCDLIESGQTGAFEAPTGLGKSLATLVPAVAHAVISGRRTVVSTYTNVLAEQYWRKDLPLALSLFDLDTAEKGIKTQFLIGRQRYACVKALREAAPDLAEQFADAAELGVETEFRQAFKRSGRQLSQLWQQVATPPVCPGRLCPHYGECHYYRARRQAERAEVVITNHSVVLQDALMASTAEDGEGLLGSFDFLILDEAHDFAQAAQNGLEFELSESKLKMLAGIVSRLEDALMPSAGMAGDARDWLKMCEEFKQRLDRLQHDLMAYSVQLGKPGILAATPAEVWEHGVVRDHRADDPQERGRALAQSATQQAERFAEATEKYLERWREEGAGSEPIESVRNYLLYIRGFAEGCRELFQPQGVAVSFASQPGANVQLRQDTIDLATPLTGLVWERTPWACLSATLALDGNFDHFKRVTGAKPNFEEVLPTPFDFASQTAVYMPKLEVVPDPAQARKGGYEEDYYEALAGELSAIIRALGGRTLALFHSRREMEAVHERMQVPEDLPILIQHRFGSGSVGDRFVKDVRASLFALRSFWTGFDAPGETLSCVALVRVPFEVPIEPTPIARMAWLQTQGHDPFHAHTLPQAKMLMRQGAGRLIRRTDDRGIIALLDPRIRTKRYGEEILANLPPGTRTFDDLMDALAHVRLDPALV